MNAPTTSFHSKLPNTPSKKMTVSVSYAGRQGFDGNVTVRLVDGYPWAAGIFQGYVPAAELVNLSAGYQISNYVRLHATATNLLDQQRYQLFGGSVIGRRVLGGDHGELLADPYWEHVVTLRTAKGAMLDMVPFTSFRVTNLTS